LPTRADARSEDHGGGLSVDHGQKRELGGVTIGEQLTSTGPLQKGVYSLTRSHSLIPKLADAELMLRAPFRNIQLQKRSEVQWDIGALPTRGRWRP
jgi:hypothetical protein